MLLVGEPHEQKIHIACGVRIALRKRANDPGLLKSRYPSEGTPQQGLNTDSLRQNLEERPYLRILPIDAIVKLAAFSLGDEQALLFQPREFPGQVRGIRTKFSGQLANVNARGPILIEVGQQIAAKLGAESKHCSNILLHLQ